MKTTDKILEIISSASDMVTLKQIQDATEIKPGIVSGSLVHLCKSGKISREKVERVSGTGPKMQWAYKKVAQTQENSLQSPSD